jgi:hypothetical protein
VKRTAETLGVAVLLLAAAALSPRALPYNMDEFVHYHALGCATAPLQQGVPAYRDGCGLYDLRLPFTTTPLPLRSYFYIGSLPALPFYPFWRWIDDPLAVRVQGAVFFLVWLLLAARLLRIGRRPLLAAALVFPALLTTFVVDEGPVGIAAVLFTTALFALRRSLRQRAAPAAGRRAAAAAAWGALAGLAVFAGIWAKLVFACWLPAVAVFAWQERRGQPGGALRRSWPALAACVFAAALPTLLLLASTDADGRPYAAAVHRGRISLEPVEVVQRLGHLLREAADPKEEAPRNVLLRRSPLDVVPAVLAVGALAAAARRSGGGRRREIATWTALAGLTLGLLSLSAYCQWPHHAFYGLLLLVLALALALDALGRRARTAAAIAIALAWGGLAVRWIGATYPVEAAPEKDALLRFVRARGLDRETLQVHTSWGTYYIAQLFGDPARTVVFVRAVSEDPAQLAEVRDLARARGRPLLMVGSRRWERFQKPEVTAVIGQPEHRWSFGEWWVAEYPTLAGPATSAFRRP